MVAVLDFAGENRSCTDAADAVRALHIDCDAGRDENISGARLSEGTSRRVARLASFSMNGSFI
jgi:hypothetical protein